MQNSLNVLVVEDHDALRQSVVSILEQEGFAVTSLSCAEDVDDEPTTAVPDLYLIDLNLPGEDGLSLTTRLRRARPDAGIIIMTARTRLDDRVRGYENGADVYLPKPVDPNELIAVIQSLGRRIVAGRSRQTGLQLEARGMILRGGGHQCRLSPAEVRLLTALAGAKDQTLERWQVAMQLKPGQEDISADSLQNRLSQLRKKLEVCGVPGQSLQSIRTLGYRLSVPITVV